MTDSMRTISVCLVAALGLSAGSTANESPAVPKVLDLFQRLQSAERQKAMKKPGERVKFRFSEAEVNEYAAHALRTTPRPGLQSLIVRISRNDYYSFQAVIDFDAVENWRPGTIPALLKPVLSGKKAVALDYTIQAQDGMVKPLLEKASFENIPLPSIFVEKLIEIVAARQPEHYDTTKPVPLPFGLRKVWTGDKVVMGEN